MRRNVWTWILAFGLVLGWATMGQAAPDQSGTLALAYQAIFAPATPDTDGELGEAVPGKDALLKPGENVPQPRSHQECFINCAGTPGTYACCNRTTHPHCQCVPLSIEIACDVYGFPPNPSCSNS